MTDRELLELAAKAAGIHLDRIDPTQRENGPNPYIEPWDPLTDDGDALRLAVKLMMIIDPYAGLVGVPPHSVMPTILVQDLCAATRRAIVRAAAEIGKGMQ